MGERRRSRLHGHAAAVLRTMLAALAIGAGLAALGACGQRGPLFLPEAANRAGAGSASSASGTSSAGGASGASGAAVDREDEEGERERDER
jgi:predicted small lipoprotein YifL